MPPFSKVEPKIDFPAQERAILAFWDEISAFAKLQKKNAGRARWSFLDGPITANNPMGVHHAWGRAYKDLFQRYHAMLGQDQRYQNGFDCQGLWVEVEVEKELGLRSKREIENIVPGDAFASIDRFVGLCKQRVDKYARVQTDQSIRLGYWMDWDRTDEDWAKGPGERRSYFTLSDENNYTIWAFLKKCHDRRFVYRAMDAMPWCPRCGVGISEQEIKEGYKAVTHTAVFVKFRLRERPGESLLVWTTTPWTLSSNVAAAVHPELTYLKVRQGTEIIYVARAALTAVREDPDRAAADEADSGGGRPAAVRLRPIKSLLEEQGGYEVVGEVLGSEMVGWKYDGPFDELPAQQSPYGHPEILATTVRERDWAPATSARDAHRVIAWKEVGETDGTGIVHIAPGCGKEDWALGREQRLPPIAPLTPEGTFVNGFGWMEGLSASDPATAEQVLAKLKEKGLLFARESFPHNYPHCWRCKTELLFRLVEEWFVNMSWRGEIMNAARQVTYLPESVGGLARELKWLEQMGDWMISKKRYWGLALPIWVDEVTGDFEVMGSREELKERAVQGWDEFEGHSPHRPWIDRVMIRNPKTGNLMRRIPDVGNPWLDAGIVPFSTMGYGRDRASWEKWFPADFITESFPGQFRNWFYAILAMSTMMDGRAPMKVLLGHALVRDETGREMHKSVGNAIEFNQAADLMGADVMRWLYCRQNPAANINFGYGPADEIRSRFVLKLWNTYSFLCNHARLDGFDPESPPVPVANRADLDRWIISDLQILVRRARASFDGFDVASLCHEVERFVDEKLSNWYLRRSRNRFGPGEPEAGRRAAFQTLYGVMTTLTRLLAPIVPFLAETMFQNLRKAGDPESVHLCEYPESDASLIDADLSEDTEALLRLVTLGLSVRPAKLRQPLAELKIRPGTEREGLAIKRFSDLLREELNVKRVTTYDAHVMRSEVKPNLKTLGPKFGQHLDELRKLITANAERIASALPGPVEIEASFDRITLESTDVLVAHVSPQGWAGRRDRDTEIMFDSAITDELKAEGLARDVVRQIQNLRKEAGLEIGDRIAVHLGSDAPALMKAVAAHRERIATETLAERWLDSAPAGAAAVTVQIEGHPLTIALSKA